MFFEILIRPYHVSWLENRFRRHVEKVHLVPQNVLEMREIREFAEYPFLSSLKPDNNEWIPFGY